MCSAFFSDFLLLPFPPHCPPWSKGRNIHRKFSVQAQFFKVLIVLWFLDWLSIWCSLLNKIAHIPYAYKEIQETVSCAFANVYFLALRDKSLRLQCLQSLAPAGVNAAPQQQIILSAGSDQNPSALKEICDNNYESYTKLISDNMEWLPFELGGCFVILKYSFASALVVTGRRATTGFQPVLPSCANKVANFCCIFLISMNESIRC